MDRLVHQPPPTGLAAPSPAAAALIAGAGRALEGRFEQVTAELMAAIEGEMPELVADEDLRERTHATARASAELITAMAQTWTDPQDLRAPHEALEWARVAADRGVSAEVLLRAYRLGHARYWDLWYAELVAQGAEPETLAEATAASSGFFFRWIDAISRPLLHAHEVQRDRRARSAEAVRGETVRALIDRAELDQSAASARLGYELGGWHVAMIAWSEGAGGDPAGTELEARTIELARALGGAAARPLLVRDGAETLWAWVRLSAEPADELLAALDLEAGGPVRVAVGRPGTGLEGF
ncbi:MAG TPA: hypothetical protein VF196_00145, partial [Casimicrobiaceae bacterium]